MDIGQSYEAQEVHVTHVCDTNEMRHVVFTRQMVIPADIRFKVGGGWGGMEDHAWVSLI